MKLLKKSILAAPSLFAILAISACGGSDATTTPPTNNYQTLNSTAATTSSLTGTAAKGNATTGIVTLSPVSGSLTHNTGRLEINDGTYVLVDADGVDANGVATDGTSILTSGSSQGFSGTYAYVVPYEQKYVSNGDSYTVPGFYGIGTTSADMNATTAQVVYNGEARGVVGTSASSNVLTNGNSIIVANFGTDKVDVTMSGFASNSSPIDTISVVGIDLNGNRFTGGTFSTSKNGTAVNVTGANTTSSANGNFFGVNSAGTLPDEVAGIAVSQGDSGLVVGAFISD